MSGVLSEAEHERLAAAVRKAEAETAGEIHVVVARRSDDYFYPAAFMLVLGSMLASFVAALVLEWRWIELRLPHFVLVEALAVVVALLLVAASPGLRPALVPPGLRDRRAHDNAVRQFLARNVHITSRRTGILIFVSLAERYAEVVADSGIADHVGQEAWSGMVSRLTEAAGRGQLAAGLERTIAEAGALLAIHVPPQPGDVNELPDHIVEM